MSNTFLNDKNNIYKELNNTINELLESNNKNYDSERIINLYKNLMDKIIQCDFENKNNLNNYESFSRSQSNYNNFKNNISNYNKNNLRNFMFETRDNSQTPNNNLESGFEDNENINHLSHPRNRDLYNEIFNNKNN